jgi:hypothetical protein
MVKSAVLVALLGGCVTATPPLKEQPRTERIDTPPKPVAPPAKKTVETGSLPAIQKELRYLNHRLSRLESELILGKSTPKDNDPEPLGLEGCDDDDDGDPTGADCD